MALAVMLLSRRSQFALLSDEVLRVSLLMGGCVAYDAFGLEGAVQMSG
jgi:hypothetical protein